jgi:hypothetical protein
MLIRLQMLSRRIATARPLRAAFPVARRQVPAVAFSQQRCLRAAHVEEEPAGAEIYPTLVSSDSFLLCTAS